MTKNTTPDTTQARQANSTRCRFPILAKLLVLVSVCTLLPLAASAILSIQRGFRAVETAARHNLELVAQVTATQLDQMFTDMSRMQATQATNSLFIQYCLAQGPARQAIAPKVQSRMAEVLATNPDLAMMYITDRQGICLISTGDHMVGKNYRNVREYIRQALAGTRYVSDLAMGTTSGEAGVFFAGPMRDEGSEIVGVMVLKLKASVIDTVCREVSQHVPHGFATVVDSREVIISHPDPALLYHSLGTLSAPELAGMTPKLQYGVEKIESAGLEGVRAELRRELPWGSVTFEAADGTSRVAGYARMKQRPWEVSVVQPQAEFDQPLRSLAWQQALGILGVGVVCVLAAMAAAHRLLRPIRSLTRAGAQAARGDWSARAEVTTHDELAELAHTFNEMMPKLRQRASMENALRLAQEIQTNLLPHEPPAVPGLDVAGMNIPADQTGGDYYDFLDLSSWREDTLALAVGDVAGHGIPAALLMTTARALLRSRATPPGTLVELMSDVNRRLCDDTPPGRFMTLLYAAIDRRNRRISLVSAGHDPIILLDTQSGEFRNLAGEDIPLGVDADRLSTEKTFDHLPETSVLLIGTDGIWETQNDRGEPFGKDRLRETLRANGRRSAQDIMAAIMAELSRFRGDLRQEDDVTLVIVKFTPLPSAAQGDA